MFRAVLVTLALLCSTSVAWAIRAPDPVGSVRAAASIVDARVDHFDARGRAHLVVASTWHGAAPTVVPMARMGCFLGTAKDAGLTVGQRYVLLLDGDGNLKGAGAFPVVDGRVDGGRLGIGDAVPIARFARLVLKMKGGQ